VTGEGQLLASLWPGLLSLSQRSGSEGPKPPCCQGEERDAAAGASSPRHVPSLRGVSGTGYPAASTPTLATAVSQLLGTPEVPLGCWGTETKPTSSPLWRRPLRSSSPTVQTTPCPPTTCAHLSPWQEHQDRDETAQPPPHNPPTGKTQWTLGSERDVLWPVMVPTRCGMRPPPFGRDTAGAAPTQPRGKKLSSPMSAKLLLNPAFSTPGGKVSRFSSSKRS